MLIFFYFFELDFSDFLSFKFLFILHFIFYSSFLSVKFLFSSFLSFNLNFFIFNIKMCKKDYQKIKDYQKEYRKNITNEQKQKYKNNRKQ